MCWRNRRWKQNTTTLSFLDVILIYDHILLCELERCGKEPSWFPPCVLSTPVMLKFLLVFQAGMSNVVWTVWLWQSNGTCLREIPVFILKWTRNGLDCFFKGLAILTFLFFAFIQLAKAGGQNRGRRGRAVREEKNELSGLIYYLQQEKQTNKQKEQTQPVCNKKLYEIVTNCWLPREKQGGDWAPGKKSIFPLDTAMSTRLYTLKVPLGIGPVPLLRVRAVGWDRFGSGPLVSALAWKRLQSAWWARTRVRKQLLCLCCVWQMCACTCV